MQSEDEVVGVVREAQQSLRVIDADNIDEMADDILAEEEADDLLEGEGGAGLACAPVSTTPGDTRARAEAISAFQQGGAGRVCSSRKQPGAKEGR